MILVDVHAHLDHAMFRNDLDEVIERAKLAGMWAIITNGINPETNRRALEIAEKYGIVKPALGIYPIDALQNEIARGEYPLKDNVFDVEDELKFIEKQREKIVAIGEIGLDFSQSEQRDEQNEVFIRLLELAQRIRKPVIVHSRKAEQEVIEVLESTNVKKVVLHCFCGKLKLVKQGADNGWYFSVPTNVVRSQQFQLMVNEVDVRQLLTETDAPYLSPFRGKRNEPSFIVESVKKISELLGREKEEVTEQIVRNYQKIFEH